MSGEDFEKPKFEPLTYDSTEQPGGPGTPKITPKPKRAKKQRAEHQPLGQRWRAFVAARTDTPQKAKRFRVASTAGGSLTFIAIGFGAYMMLRPYPKPDYEDDPLDELFNYTLFQNEFNDLPLEERVRLIGSLVQRMESMGGSDGTLLAAFASGIAGSARDQLEENAAQLMLDFIDHFAKDYKGSSDPENQQDYLRQAVIDMTRLAEEFDGRPSKKSDEKILEEAFAQARRDQEAFRDPKKGPSLGGVTRMADMMENRIGARGTPHQRARNIRLMRDMSRYLRNQDVSSGKPNGGG